MKVIYLLNIKILYSDAWIFQAFVFVLCLSSILWDGTKDKESTNMDTFERSKGCTVKKIMDTLSIFVLILSAPRGGPNEKHSTNMDISYCCSFSVSLQFVWRVFAQTNSRGIRRGPSPRPRVPLSMIVRIPSPVLQDSSNDQYGHCYSIFILVCVSRRV